MSDLQPTTDGLVTIRAPEPGDARILIAGRDEIFHRWFGPGADEPRPTACIVVAEEIIGWVDYDVDADHGWLDNREVNVGYYVFAAHRGKGYATRAVQLLMHHLAVRAEHHTATLLINPRNARSLALAARTRFAPSGDINGDRYFKRPVPALGYTDGVVTIRRARTQDLDQDAFGTGPKWTFAVYAQDAECVASVGCDFANAHVPRGEANISYSSQPAYQRSGYVSRAVRLMTQFLRDHTGARTAHLLIDEENVASLRVAHAVGAAAREQWVDDRGHVMTRFILGVGSNADVSGER